jgi:hypothetical protein
VTTPRPDGPYAPVLIERLRAVHRALDAAGFAHAFGGAIALGVHVEPRMTSDIDINVIAAADELQAVLDAMPSDVSVPEGAADELLARGQIRLMWPNPSTPINSSTTGLYLRSS